MTKPFCVDFRKEIITCPRPFEIKKTSFAHPVDAKGAQKQSKTPPSQLTETFRVDAGFSRRRRGYAIAVDLPVTTTVSGQTNRLRRIRPSAPPVMTAPVDAKGANTVQNAAFPTA
jgi:hypothetical protein